MKRYYPYIYGAIAGALTFIAMVYICLHSFAMTTAQSVIWGVIGFILVGASSSYTEYAIAELQRIAELLQGCQRPPQLGGSPLPLAENFKNFEKI